MNINNINKPKLLRLTNCILHYSIPTNNRLSDVFDLTVAHYGEKIEVPNNAYSQIILTPRKIGPFRYFKENIYKLACNFDAILADGDLHDLPFILLGLKRSRKFTLTFWGIGVSASYKKKFDEDRSLDWIRFKLMDKADSLVFYSDYPIKRYISAGLKAEKLFVAHNTIDIQERVRIPKVKKYLLFVGSLYKEKKIYELLEAYLKALERNDKVVPLIIVGDGIERFGLEKWIERHKLNHMVELKGAIFDFYELREIHKFAIALISPGQAGLSVLSSMAFGVPFVTRTDSITGGERLNIVDKYNGYYYDNVESLSEIIEKLSVDVDAVYQISVNAQNYYFENRTMDHMIGGINSAINYALQNRVADY